MGVDEVTFVPLFRTLVPFGHEVLHKGRGRVAFRNSEPSPYLAPRRVGETGRFLFGSVALLQE